MAQPVDILIIGAGPAGLYAAYYAGFRGFSVAVLDALPELGGQITALYPEKLIYDVAGFPAIKGQDLVDALVEQAASANPRYLLGHSAVGLEHSDDSVTVTTDEGVHVTAKTVLITGGIGSFSPRPLPGAEGWDGHGLHYFVPHLDDLAGLDVVIVGGGDSALDWAQALEPIAKSVALVHRRSAFRAHKATVEKVTSSSVRVLVPFEVAALHGAGRVESVEVYDNTADEVHELLQAQAVVAALGFHADLGPITEWGLDLHKRHIVVDSAMRTSVSRVFAAGDIVDYDGKVKLVSVGFGEAATAINNAAVVIDPALHVFPGHSTEPG